MHEQTFVLRSWMGEASSFDAATLEMVERSGDSRTGVR
jgi:hypothetical protein